MKDFVVTAVLIFLLTFVGLPFSIYTTVVFVFSESYEISSALRFFFAILIPVVMIVLPVIAVGLLISTERRRKSKTRRA